MDLYALRFDAGVRIDGGMVAQVGAMEAVAYGNDDLPRYGARDAFACPIFAPDAPATLAERFGGLPGRLTPGSPAHLALFHRDRAPSRADLIAALRGEASGLSDLFVAGCALIVNGAAVPGADQARAALAASLERPQSTQEEALWAAARRAARSRS